MQKIITATTFQNPLIVHPVKKHLSNFDLTGDCLVRRGSIVSWHGLRLVVSRVRCGYFFPKDNRMKVQQIPCSSVQVVGFQSLGQSSRRAELERGPLAGMAPALHAVHPVGNTGITSNVAVNV